MSLPLETTEAKLLYILAGIKSGAFPPTLTRLSPEIAEKIALLTFRKQQTDLKQQITTGTISILRNPKFTPAATDPPATTQNYYSQPSLVPKPLKIKDNRTTATRSPLKAVSGNATLQTVNNGNNGARALYYPVSPARPRYRRRQMGGR